MTKFERMEPKPPAEVQKRYPGGVPAKFNIDGSVRAFSGNTIICHLPLKSQLHGALTALYRELEASNPDTLYSLLPPSSWHMTVFEGVCDQVRHPGFWPSDLVGNAPIDECNRVYAERLLNFDIDAPPPYKLRIGGFSPLVDGISLSLKPASEKEEARLRMLRDRLAERLCIRHPSHETYVFHLSIAYFIRLPTSLEQAWLEARLNSHLAGMSAEFELGAPEFCYFDDMFAFHRQFYLK